MGTVTTEARGLPHLKPHLKLMLMPKPPLMPGTDIMVVDTDMVDTVATPDTMAVTVVVTDTVWDTTDTDTVWDTVATTDTEDTAVVTTVKKLILDCNILPFFFNNPPLELSKPTLLPSAILLKLCFFL